MPAATPRASTDLRIQSISAGTFPQALVVEQQPRVFGLTHLARQAVFRFSLEGRSEDAIVSKVARSGPD